MNCCQKHKRAAIFGFIFGLIAPAVGIFLGLVVSTTLGNIFAFPFILVSMITGTPFGEFSKSVMILAWILSAVLWSLIFVLVAKLLAMRKKS